MPTIPRYQQQVQQQGLPGVRVSPDAPAGAFGDREGIQNVTKAGLGLNSFSQKIFEEEKQRADDVATMDVFSKATKQKNERLYAEGGLLSRKGKDAFGAEEEIGGAYKKDLEELEKGLYNETQKSVFKSMRSKLEAEMDGTIQKHVHGERQKFDDDVTSQLVATTKEDAIMNYQNPGKVAVSLDTMKMVLHAKGAKIGWPEEWVNERVRFEASGIHTGIITQMLRNQDDKSATGYYEQFKDQLTDRDKVVAQGIIEEGNIRGESKRKTDAVIASNPPDVKTALEAVKDIEDPKIKSATSERIKDYFDLKARDQMHKDNTAFNQASEILEKSKDPDKIPPDLFAGLKDDYRKAIEKRMKQIRKGEDAETDWNVYYSLQTMASTPALKNKFLQTNLTAHRADLGDTEWKELVGIQAGLRNKDAKTEDLLEGFRTTNQVVTDLMNEIGVDPTPKPDDKDVAEKSNEFKTQVEERIRSLQKRENRKANPEEIKDIVHTLGKEVITSRGWFSDTTKRVFELKPGETGELKDLEQIPREERAKIEDWARRNKVTLTPQIEMTMYLKKIGKVLK